MYALAETVVQSQVGFTNDAGSVTGVTVTASGTTHNDGTWIDITSSTPIEANGFHVLILEGSAAFRGLLDIAIGTTNEDEIVSDILVDFNRANAQSYSIYFEHPIPSGSGISARLRAATASVSVKVAIVLELCSVDGDQHLGAVETIGTDTTAGSGASSGRLDSGGSQVDPGGSSQAFGSWKELSAGITYDCVKAKLIAGCIQNNAMVSNITWRVQIGIGASGQEQVVHELLMCTNSTHDSIYPLVHDFPFVAAAGSRVSVRASSNNTDATDRLFECAMYLSRQMR